MAKQSATHTVPDGRDEADLVEELREAGVEAELGGDGTITVTGDAHQLPLARSIIERAPEAASTEEPDDEEPADDEE